MKEIRLDLYRSLGVDNPERYLIQSQKPFSGDPLSENQMALTGTALDVQPHQQDEAHIMVHAVMVNNPLYAENLPMRQAMMAHINQHLASRLRKEVISLVKDPQLKQVLTQGGPLPPEVENQVAIRVAEISDRILKLDEARQSVLRGDSTDPIIKLQEEELRLKGKSLDLDKVIEMAKLKLQEVQMRLDDQNADMDRAAKLRIAMNKL